MDDIVIPMDILSKNSLSINEYLILYNLVNNYSIEGTFTYDASNLSALEKKGFIKLTQEKIHLREKTEKIFSLNNDLFLNWLEKYPTSVKKTRTRGSRALSPADPDTILGRRLKKKWEMTFRNNLDAQKEAIQVLELQLKDMKKSGDLEFMVEAHRWLNEGYFEKYSYLLDEGHLDNKYENEDYM